MFRKIITLTAIGALLISFAAGCAGSKPPVEGTKELVAGGEPPDWANTPGKESSKESKAFVGLSRQYAMEQQARNDARLNAYIQAIDDMGAYGERKIFQVVSEQGVSTDVVNSGIVQDEMTRLKTKGAAMGDIKEWHVQQWRVFDGGRWREYFVARCLFMMPRDAVKKFMENILKQQADAAQAEKEKANLMRALDKMKELQAEDW